MSKWFSAIRSATCGFTPWKKRNSLHPENTSHGAQTQRQAAGVQGRETTGRGNLMAELFLKI